MSVMPDVNINLATAAKVDQVALFTFNMPFDLSIRGAVVLYLNLRFLE